MLIFRMYAKLGVLSIDKHKSKGEFMDTYNKAYDYFTNSRNYKNPFYKEKFISCYKDALLLYQKCKKIALHFHFFSNK